MWLSHLYGKSGNENLKKLSDGVITITSRLSEGNILLTDNNARRWRQWYNTNII